MISSSQVENNGVKNPDVCTEINDNEERRPQERCLRAVKNRTIRETKQVKITFQTTAPEQTPAKQTQRFGAVPMEKAGAAYETFFTPDTDMVLGNASKKSWAEIRQDAENKDISVQQDYMTLMSHTMSEEDYAKLEEEGFHFESLDPEEAVTILDKIKAELARSGQNIVGYTDDLDLSTLSAALGSDSLARAITQSFREADVPLTPENIEGVKKAWEMASQLTQMGEGAERYLVDNGMEPEIWNIYLAQSSGARGKEASLGQTGGNRAPKYYAEEIKGYYAESAKGGETQGLEEQIDRVVEKAGLRPDADGRKMGQWLLENGLPLTEENLKRLNAIQELRLPMAEEDFAAAAANAVADGKEPFRANLEKRDNIYQRAADILSYYQNLDLPQGAESVAARRQLEEIRLRMTAEVNVKLLKSGFSIDTAPMEELVEALKEAVQKLAAQYFPKDAQALEEYRSYHESSRILAQLPGLPARILGPWSVSEGAGSLTEFYKQGSALKEAYVKAGESYEALMTSPRRDLGDSISKAFANVDAILEDMMLETSAENRRAVRILGYNSMEITQSGIELVKAADAQVQSLMEKMTPAATLRMIRDGVNPLERTLQELDQYFAELPEEFQESAESYSRFLYGLEQNKSITPEERETYIGIYRLLRQIEKSDGAVIGALVNSQAQLHLNNLLSAVRTGRFKHMDVRVTDELGTISELLHRGESISHQIERAFVKNAENALTEAAYSEEASESYRSQELSRLRQAVISDQECYALLQRGQITPSAGNLLAAQELLKDMGIFRGIWKDRGEDSEKETASAEEQEASALWESLDEKDTFRSRYEDLVGRAAKEAERAVTETDSFLDVRNLRLAHKRLTLAGSLAAQEEYFLSMYIGEELTGIHLTVERGEEETGRVRIDCRFSQEEGITARFRLKDGTIFGDLSGNEKTEVTKLLQIADTFTSEASKRWTVEGITLGEGTLGGAETLISREAAPGAAESRPDNGELYRVAKIFLEAVRQ